jgi:CRP-like cAMP-binding protein
VAVCPLGDIYSSNFRFGGHSMSSIRATTESLAESRLLAALPPAEQLRLLPELESTTFALGDIVYESGQRLHHIYFPTSCIASLVVTTQSGVTAEVALVGNEGALGIALFLGGATMPNRAVVQIAGGALRMRANTLRAEIEHSGPFRRLLSRYTQALITEVSQTAVCNRLHRVEQRLCRRILLCRDRQQSDELLMTHEFMANMLGGRRQSVTAAAGRLQEAGLIHYARGHIKILDRAGLERSACECYSLVKIELDRLLGLEKRGRTCGQRVRAAA